MAEHASRSTFTRWLTEYGGLMRKVVRSFAPRPEDQDDLFQEIALQLWSSIPSFREEARASTWVYRVSLNTALTWQRGERRRRKRHEPLLAPDGVPDSQAGDTGASDKQGMLGWVYEQLRLLRPIDRALMLLYLDGVSYREMAGILGISESNVGVKLSRIKGRLAQAVKGR